MLTTFLLWTLLAAPRVRVVRVPPVTAAERILFIAAHPDDEIMAGALLGRHCVEGSADCSILVLTRGGAGSCALPIGCHPSVGDVRTAEMQRAAAFLEASLIQWDLPDVMTAVGEQWGTNVVDEIRSVIRDRNPDAIITLDPHHGSTCHPAHRTLGAIVSAAATNYPAGLFFIETVVTFAGEEIVFSSGSEPPGQAIDVSAHWDFVTGLAAIHGSQFSEGQVAALARVPSEQRRLWLVPASQHTTLAHIRECP